MRGDLGRAYSAGECVVRQGEEGDSMFVVLQGTVEVVREEGGKEHVLSELKAGDFFGEMALFSRERRSATVRAKGEARLLTVDRRGFLKSVHEDPSMAFRILEKMSQRVRSLNAEVSRLRQEASERG